MKKKYENFPGENPFSIATSAMANDENTKRLI